MTIIETITNKLNDTPALAYVLGGALTTLLVYAIVLAWGAIHGHFITNVSLALELKRRASTRDSDKHELVTIIKIEKGTVHALTVQTLKIELFSLNQDSLDHNIAQWYLPTKKDNWRVRGIWVPPKPDNHSVPPKPNNRSLNNAGTLYSERHVLAFWTPEDKRAENFAPSERTQYASYSTIEANDVYEAVVTLVGMRYRSLLVKWVFELIYILLYMCFSYRPQRTYYTASAISIPADAAPTKNSKY